MDQPIASLDKIAQMIRQVLPDFDDYLTKIKNSQIHLPKDFQQAIKFFQIENYAEYYQDESELKRLFVDSLGEPDLKRLLEENPKIPLANVRDYMDSTLDEFNHDLAETLGEEPEDIDVDEIRALPEAEIEQFKQFFLFGILVFHDLTSLLVFGERIFSLTQKAITGDRGAMLKVIQIDPSSLTHIPAFRLAHAKAMQSRERRFLNSINHCLNNRVGKSRLKHRHIYLVFFYLHNFKCLEGMTATELFDFCDSVGLIRYEEIADERGMRRLKNQFLDAHR